MTERICYLCGIISFLATVFSTYKVQFGIIGIAAFIIAFIVHGKDSSKSKKSEIRPENYNFVDPPGYFTHKTKGGKFCPHCLPKGSLSPLSTDKDIRNVPYKILLLDEKPKFIT